MTEYRFTDLERAFIVHLYNTLKAKNKLKEVLVYGYTHSNSKIPKLTGEDLFRYTILK